jgi:hypothetical protein
MVVRLALALILLFAATGARAEAMFDGARLVFDGRVLTLDPVFQPLGVARFRLSPTIEGERFIWAETDGARIKRLFMAQFERIAADAPATYKYDLSNGELIAGLRFRTNVFPTNNAKAASDKPGAESDVTLRFLHGRGLAIDDEWAMARWVTVTDGDRRKAELILFYVETLPSLGLKLDELVRNGEATPALESLSPSLLARARAQFHLTSR